jgi:hypothetical protein
MTTAQKLERHFFINLITLVNEVQSDVTTLPSQVNSHSKSKWIKSIKKTRIKSSALNRV